MRGALTFDDHAFADGPTFLPTLQLEEAMTVARSFATDEADCTSLATLLLRISERFRSGAMLGENIRLGTGARLINGGARELIYLHGPGAIRGILRAEAGGSVHIGRFCYIGDQTIISARSSVTIGEATLVAHGVQIFDNNSHPIHAFNREVQFRRMLGDKSVQAPLEIDAAPIVIGRRCWIGMNSLVMKGVAIGDDTVVAAGSVVISSLPEGVIAGGNPARVIRELTPEERGRSQAATTSQSST